MRPEDYSTISFPSLGIEWNPPRGFAIGSLELRLYGVMIALGLILAVIYGLRRRKKFGIEENDILDGVLIIVPIAVICARLYYCIFEWQQYAADPITILHIWKGGLAIYGAVIGAVVSAAIFCYVRKIKIPAALDLVVLGFMIGQSIGRWGNFFNREAVGLLPEGSNWFLRMGLLNESTGQWEYFHPTFLYESLWNAVGLLCLHLFSRKRQYDGQVTLLYVAWYGLGRAMIEGLRMDSLYWGNFRVSQLLAVVTCSVAVIALAIMAFRKHDLEKLYVNQIARRFQAADDAEQTALAEDAEEAEPEEETGEIAEEAEEVAEAEETAEEPAVEEESAEEPTVAEEPTEE